MAEQINIPSSEPEIQLQLPEALQPIPLENMTSQKKELASFPETIEQSDRVLLGALGASALVGVVGYREGKERFGHFAQEMKHLANNTIIGLVTAAETAARAGSRLYHGTKLKAVMAHSKYHSGSLDPETDSIEMQEATTGNETETHQNLNSRSKEQLKNALNRLEQQLAHAKATGDWSKYDWVEHFKAMSGVPQDVVIDTRKQQSNKLQIEKRPTKSFERNGQVRLSEPRSNRDDQLQSEFDAIIGQEILDRVHEEKRRRGGVVKLPQEDFEAIRDQVRAEFSEKLVKAEDKQTKRDRPLRKQAVATTPAKKTATKAKAVSKADQERARRAVEDNARRTALDLQ